MMETVGLCQYHEFGMLNLDGILPFTICIQDRGGKFE
jgi:hypothetical protein